MIDSRNQPLEANDLTMQCHYTKLLRAMLRAPLLLVAISGAAVAGPLEDALAAQNRGDDATALRLFRPLADQGNAEAQYNLGLMYANGLGPMDLVQADMWLSLAEERGTQEAAKNRDIVEEHMTPVQIADAHKLAREWKSKSEH